MSGKKELQQIIENQLVKKTLELIEDTDSEGEEDDNELFILGLLALNEERYLETRTYNSVAKSKHWYNDILPAYDDIRFKKILRMIPENFKLLVNLIKNHSIFQSNSSKQQSPVELQLAVFIRRLGSKNDIFSICSNFGIAEGTVILFCKRVMKAIISHKTSYIKWPNGQVREFVHEGFKEIGGIEDIIGSIDGTHFILQNAPTKDKEVYFTRKKRYALHCQGIVDHRGIFLDYDVGWPGSVHDAKVYRHSHFYSNKSSLIKGNDFLIGDSAYPLSPFLIKPYNKPNNEQKIFNQIFSSHRIVVEHSFGRLKNRFAGIREIAVKKISTAVNLIDCAIILHNYLELLGDIWDDQEDDDNFVDEEDDDDSNGYDEEELKRAGESKRNWIMRKLFTSF